MKTPQFTLPAFCQRREHWYWLSHVISLELQHVQFGTALFCRTTLTLFQWAFTRYSAVGQRDGELLFCYPHDWILEWNGWSSAKKRIVREVRGPPWGILVWCGVLGRLDWPCLPRNGIQVVWDCYLLTLNHSGRSSGRRMATFLCLRRLLPVPSSLWPSERFCHSQFATSMA